MKLRVARHTKNLQAIIHFYQDILGLEFLGEFKSHNNYDGVFLGLKDLNWHLEFTVSDQAPNHHPDKDDLLVFYIESEKQFNHLKEQFKRNQIRPVDPVNPYWEANGITYEDPNGFRIVIAIQKK